jgi:parallel beta-helix repeat protein
MLFLVTLSELPITSIANPGRIITVPDDYATIQAAINAATPGDTVHVRAGEYAEHVLVNKSITLEGENRVTIITGQPTPPRIIDVTASYVTIKGLTVKATGTLHGIYVEPPYGQTITAVTITDNMVVNTYGGVFLSYCMNCLITNNTFQNDYYAIRLHDSDYNIIKGNYVNASIYYGINLYAHSDNNTISQNALPNGRYGILLEWSDKNLIKLNSISYSMEYAIRLSYSTTTTAWGNTMLKNKYGVYIWNCSGNQFYFNNFIQNTNQVAHFNASVTANLWDTNIRPGTKGNYWSDYSGVDDGSGVGRWGEVRFAGDGVGDTQIPHLQVDWYPLMHPWTPVPLRYPQAIFTWDPIEPIAFLPAIFNASESYDADGIIIQYEWDFGDGNITAVTTPVISHTFTNAGDYTVKLTVKDNDLLTNYTSHIVRVLPSKVEIDVYTQHPEPYSGRGPNMPSDAFAPQSNVILYAQVAYNYEPVENKIVVFTVTDPTGLEIFYRTANTSASGLAVVDFRLGNEPFGNYTVFASVEISQRKANDTLTFRMGWLVEIVGIETEDQYGVPKYSFAKSEKVYFSIDVQNIAFTSKNATLTVGVQDETGMIIGAVGIKLEVPPGTHKYNLVFNIMIPKWTLVGSSSSHANAYTDWPWSHGVPYCPEISISFMITPS